MLYNQVTLESFQDEGIPITSGSLHAYRVLFRRILYFFYNHVVYDDTVVFLVDMCCRP